MKGTALTALYDCLSVLSASPDFKEYPELVMTIINAHWSTFANADRRLLPLLECLDNCVRSLGSLIQSFVEPVFNRCCLLI